MSRNRAEAKENKEKLGGDVFDLLDEAYFLLKENLFDILPLHLFACVPFLLGVMFFIFRFSSFHSNDLDIIKWALLMTILFCWKNFFQCLLSGRIMDIIARRDHRKFSIRDSAMIFFKQTVIHSGSLVLIFFIAAFPLTCWIFFPLLLILPALLYTSAVINAIEPEHTFLSFLQTTARHISRDFIKMLAIMLAISAGIIILTINIAVIIFMVPFLLKIFWGVDTEFTIAGNMSFSMFFNTTLWSIIFGLVWLAADPFCRIIYVLRVFYFESIGKGWDIQAVLNRISAKTVKTVLALVLLTASFMLNAGSAKPETPPRKDAISAARLEKQIDRTLDDLEFQWRRPHKESKEESWIKYYIVKAINYCVEILRSVIDYIMSLFKGKNKGSSTSMSGFGAFLVNLWDVLKFLLPALLLVIILIFIWRKFRGSARPGNNSLTTVRRPDLTRKNVTANELEEHEWLALGSELLEKGEFRLALRAFYLAGISALAQRKLLLVRRYKTDYEYLSELRRRAHAMPQLIPVFETNVGIFQRVWYGDYPVDRAMLEQYLERSKILFPEKKNDENEGTAHAEE